MKITRQTAIVSIILENLGNVYDFLVNVCKASDAEAQCVVDSRSKMTLAESMKEHGLYDPKKTEANNVNGFRARMATWMGNMLDHTLQPVREETGFTGGRGRRGSPLLNAITSAIAETNRVARSEMGLGTKGLVPFDRQIDFNGIWERLFRKSISEIVKAHGKPTNEGGEPMKMDEIVETYLSSNLYPESTVRVYEAAQQAVSDFRTEHEIGTTSPIPTRLQVAFNREVRKGFLALVKDIRSKFGTVLGKDGEVATNDTLVDQFCGLFDSSVAALNLAAHEADVHARTELGLSPQGRVHDAVRYNKLVSDHFKAALSKLRKEKNVTVPTNDEAFAYVTLYEEPASETKPKASKPKGKGKNKGDAPQADVSTNTEEVTASNDVETPADAEPATAS